MLEAFLDLDPARAEETLLRYAGAGPRYTSYPTAPAWSESYGPEQLREDLGRLAGTRELALYAHVPFCRSLCHFCACNRVITRRPEPPEHYLDSVAREVEVLRAVVPGAPRTAWHHWGGGTPTHLAPAQIRRLFRCLDDAFPRKAGAEVSVEADPRVTRTEQLEVLRECGFQRLSLGVQDFDPRVQEAVHRQQTAAATAALVDAARERGFESVNLDLIYGLPFQTVESFAHTLDQVIAIAPERIALYGYAHVTWVARQQRGFERGDLPDPRARLRIFLLAIRRLLEAGYAYIGLDHFARPGDELARAAAGHTLRRNFMGYTTRPDLALLGFGPSAISEPGPSYAQSHRELDRWSAAVAAGTPATLRGHRLSRDDQERGFVIASLMCHGEVSAADYEARFGEAFAARFAAELARLAALEEDGLLERGPAGVRVTPLGRLAVRNVAMVFDAYLPAQRQEDRPLFSQTV
jgi:oxygen-independent coproporphyrinogen-3 oxidase